MSNQFLNEIAVELFRAPFHALSDDQQAEVFFAASVREMQDRVIPIDPDEWDNSSLDGETDA